MDKEELFSHVDEHYFVYDLFASADISWKKSHSCQPKVRFKVSQKKDLKSDNFLLRTKLIFRLDV